MAAQRKNQGPPPPPKDEVAERRREVAAELKAREQEKKAAWAALKRDRKEADERREALAPDPEFAENARLAAVRGEQERIELHRRGYEKEAKRRNSDEVLEKRWSTKHAADYARHLARWSRVQEVMIGTDELQKREALREMATAWSEKEDQLVALASKKSKIVKQTGLERKAEKIKSTLAVLEKSRKAATAKPVRLKKAKRTS